MIASADSFRRFVRQPLILDSALGQVCADEEDIRTQGPQGAARLSRASPTPAGAKLTEGETDKMERFKSFWFETSDQRS